MDTAAIFSIALGFCSVLQAGLNRKIASHFGFVRATLLNNVVLLLATVALYFIFCGKEGMPSQPLLRGNQTGRLLLWCWVPGILGLALVMGIPFAISRIGSLQVFTILIVTQIFGSMIWDMFCENKSMTWARSLGIILSLLGTILVMSKE